MYLDFRKVYQLRIYEPPESVMLLIRELHPGKGWVEISRVFIPFPDEHNDLDAIDFGSDIVVEKFVYHKIFNNGCLQNSKNLGLWISKQKISVSSRSHFLQATMDSTGFCQSLQKSVLSPRE